MLRLCLTGGPGSGKTVIFNHLSQILEERGYFVFLVPETVPELLMNGIKPNSYISKLAFQNFVMNKQLEKEKLYERLSKYYPKDKIVIIYDKGLFDIGVDLELPVFYSLLEKHKITVADAYDHYDTVIHLTTAADGAPKFYQWDNPALERKLSNVAIDNPEFAIEKDRKTKELWSEHPRLSIIPAYANFSDKLKEVVRIVFNRLGERIPPIKPRKLIIKKPNDAVFSQLNILFKTNIIQTYLTTQHQNIDRFVMQRGTQENGFTFYYVEKVKMEENEEKFVTEKQISQQEYSNYLVDADRTLIPINKVRRSFIYENRYYEIETYQFNSSFAILEIDNDINDFGHFPPFEIIQEVTHDPRYKTKMLAKRTHFPIDDDSRQTIAVQNNWIYETGREEKGFSQSDSRFYGVEMTKDENTAIKLFAERGRTYLIRYKDTNEGRLCQWYDKHSHTWNDN